jgi:hypothetical protein
MGQQLATDEQEPSTARGGHSRSRHGDVTRCLEEPTWPRRQASSAEKKLAGTQF